MAWKIRLEPTSDVVTIPLDDNYPRHTLRIGRDVDSIVRDDIGLLLGKYKDVFAFDPFEIPGIAVDIMQHRLNVDPNHRPVIKKKRHLGEERSDVMRW